MFQFWKIKVLSNLGRRPWVIIELIESVIESTTN